MREADQKRVIIVETVGKANTHPGLCIILTQYGSTSNNIAKMVRGDLDNSADASTERIRDSQRDTGENLGHFPGALMAHSFCFGKKKSAVTHTPKSSLT